MIKELAGFIQDYWDIIYFFFPLGVIGLWRWGVWLFKKVVSLPYRPARSPYYSQVSVVTPVYNEEPVIFESALGSWQKNNPDEIIAVIDYTDVTCINIFKKFSKQFPKAKLIITRKPGKRPALAEGIRAAKSEIVALVDGDIIWADDVIKNSLSPFNDPKIAGVGTRQNVLKPETLPQKIFDIQLDQRYFDEMPFLATAGGYLSCLSGRTAFYRRKILLPLLDELVNETFLGKRVISGEDKRLTYLVEAAGWKVAYQSSAQIFTPGAKVLSIFLKQRLRWSRNSWRADLRALWQGWVWKHPGLAFYLVDRIFQPLTLLLSPIYLVLAIVNEFWLPVIIIFIWWHVSRLIKIYHHLRRKPGDIKILPFYVVFTFTTAVIRIYALFTLNVQGWITRWDLRRLPRFRFLQVAPAYVATILVFFLLTAGVSAYKETSPFVAFSAKNQEFQSRLLSIDSLSSDNLSEVLGANVAMGEAEGMIARYEVKPGDSLSSIAYEFDVSAFELMKMNNPFLPNWNILESGMLLNIPRQSINFEPGKTYPYRVKRFPRLQIIYDSLSNTINVSGRGNKVNLSDIRSFVGEKYLRQTNTKEWYLAVNLNIKPGVTLKLDRSEVEWLKLASNKDYFVWLRTYGGAIIINGVKITSWDENLNDYDREHKNGRSFIAAKYSAIMDIYDSEIAYLGYFPPPAQDSSTYGISWKLANGTFGKYLLTGKVINSKFHHNYYGAYTYGATGMVWRGNEFYENVQYGLDPHDDSNGFLVENNKAYNNGNHGIIFSKRCFNNLIRNNFSFNNGLHGIMLDRASNNNTIENNTVFGNKDGIALYESSLNIIRNNNIYNNQRGIRANMGSKNNLIEANQIDFNSQYGIYLYNEANGNLVYNNYLAENGNAIYIKSNNNELTKNVLEKNKIGIYLLGTASNNRIFDNQLTSNKIYGIYLKTAKGVENFLSLD